MSQAQIQESAACPVHDERQKDDDQYGDHQPEEEHDDSGNCVPGYCSRSSHGLQLPCAERIIRGEREVHDAGRPSSTDSFRMLS